MIGRKPLPAASTQHAHNPSHEAVTTPQINTNLTTPQVVLQRRRSPGNVNLQLSDVGKQIRQAKMSTELNESHTI